MNKAQLVGELSNRFDGNRKNAQHALESVLDVITRTVVKGEKVVITGFGAFEKVDRAARTARNPATGARVRVKKTSVPKFRPGTELKSLVSGSKKLPKLAASTGSVTNRRASSSTAAASAPTRGTAARKATTSTARKSSASKTSTAKKSTAAAKTSTAKTTTRKTAARKASATTKAAASKRTPAKSTAKKTTAAAKKSTAKKSTAKRTAAKKS